MEESAMRVKQNTLAWTLLAVLVLAACSPAPAAAPPAAPTAMPTAMPAAEEAAPSALPEMEPSVTASDQSAVNGTVSIDQVVAAQAGWIVIHIDANGAPGPVIGYAPVTAGSNSAVAVEIDLVQATPTLHAMLHVDAGQLGTYEFPGDDGPVRAGEAIVMVPFQLLESQLTESQPPEITY
jgi:glucose/arabinose dehydrogenase